MFDTILQRNGGDGMCKSARDTEMASPKVCTVGWHGGQLESASSGCSDRKRGSYLD